MVVMVGRLQAGANVMKSKMVLFTWADNKSLDTTTRQSWTRHDHTTRQ